MAYVADLRLYVFRYEYNWPILNPRRLKRPNYENRHKEGGLNELHKINTIRIMLNYAVVPVVVSLLNAFTGCVGVV
mgnify:CR=1 FL=1